MSISSYLSYKDYLLYCRATRTIPEVNWGKLTIKRTLKDNFAWQKLLDNIDLEVGYEEGRESLILPKGSLGEDDSIPQEIKERLGGEKFTFRGYPTKNFFRSKDVVVHREKDETPVELVEGQILVYLLEDGESIIEQLENLPPFHLILVGHILLNRFGNGFMNGNKNVLSVDFTGARCVTYY